LEKGLQHVALQGAGVPFLLMLFCDALWTWRCCFGAGQSLAAPLASALALLVVASTFRAHGYVYGVLALAGAVAGTYCGEWNYVHNTAQYCAISDGRYYSGNVRTDANAAEYEDAGKLRFEEGARVRVDLSVGFLQGGVNYCAAPIISGKCALAAPSGQSTDATAGWWPQDGANASTSNVSAPQCVMEVPPHVDFWAVGEDCCDPRGRFACWSGPGQREARAGVVLRSVPSTSGYLHAVRAAADVFGLPDPVGPGIGPVLVRWGSDLDSLQKEPLLASLRSFFEALGVALLVLADLALGCVFLERQRRLQKQLLLAEEQRRREAEARAEMTKRHKQSRCTLL